MQPVIAEKRLVYRRSDDEMLDVRLYLRAPYDLRDSSWGCYCHIEGLLDQEQRICGDDALQALCLAIRFLEIHLHDVVARGGQFYFPDDLSEAIPVELCFGAVPR